MHELLEFRSTDATSRIAGAVSVVVAASVGLAAALLTPDISSSSELQQASPLVESQPQEDALEAPIPNRKELIQFCSRHVTPQRSFVIFENGSVVLLAEPCSDPLSRSRNLLERSARSDARFLTENTNDGGLLITFQESLIGWIPRMERDLMQRWADRNLDLLFSSEELATRKPGWTPPPDARLGLLTRKRMLEDAASLKVVKIVRARNPLNS